MTTHLSTRLVWHDRAWDGHICDHPSKNAYCIVQEHIRDGRDDAREDMCLTTPACPTRGLPGSVFSCGSDDPLVTRRAEIKATVKKFI